MTGSSLLGVHNSRRLNNMGAILAGAFSALGISDLGSYGRWPRQRGSQAKPSMAEDGLRQSLNNGATEVIHPRRCSPELQGRGRGRRGRRRKARYSLQAEQWRALSS
ncbi:cysteine-rich protein 1 isoform X1 [Rhineura floridana]|uniref:cysteine-rich protein 1 isoform X1 n=1 Tax=Rhineura floridana TaxID=261503 RepID=UPI002AC7F04C|nr:cysteine-rich protein 1 isoform X1 [Rhineura floridana]